jgi:hypothetical protein
MKSVRISLLSLSAVVMSFLGAQAQDKFEVGVKAGVNLSHIRGEGGGSFPSFWQEEVVRTTGFTGGVYARIGDGFYIQPEILFSQKGGNFTDIVGIERTFKQTYIDVPILVGTRILNTVRVNAGPVATFLVDGDDKFLNQIGITQEDGFRNAILGYQAGVGFDIKKSRLDLRYEGNVNDVFNIDYNDQKTENQFSGKGSLFMFTVGYAF